MFFGIFVLFVIINLAMTSAVVMLVAGGAAKDETMSCIYLLYLFVK